MGPYHLARLAGAAGEADGAARIIGIEIAETDAEYDWEVVKGSGLLRYTVFPGQSYHDLKTETVESGLAAALDDIRPSVVAINGWSVTESRVALDWAAQCRARTILMSETKEDDKKRVWWTEALKRHRIRKFDAALVGGNKQKDYLIKLGMPQEFIHLGYDVIDNQYFSNGAERAKANQGALRRRLDLPDKYFFACTRFLPRKNVDGLLRAYARYRARSNSPWA